MAASTATLAAALAPPFVALVCALVAEPPPAAGVLEVFSWFEVDVPHVSLLQG
jgi:hypothetical protein